MEVRIGISRGSDYAWDKADVTLDESDWESLKIKLGITGEVRDPAIKFLLLENAAQQMILLEHRLRGWQGTLEITQEELLKSQQHLVDLCTVKTGA